MEAKSIPSSGSSTGSFLISFSTLSNDLSSDGVTIMKASPRRPARPVRPMRWT